jgi:hypothetical protein
MPEPFSKSEPWIFAVFVNFTGSDWTINDFHANILNVGDISKTNIWSWKTEQPHRNVESLLATRCRLVFADMVKKEVYQ